MESMTLEKATARLFEDNFDCAQTVFSHFAEELDLDEETALKIAAGFGGGMHKVMNQKAMEYERRIQEVDEGCLRCREMLGVDPSTPEGKAQAMNIIPKKCPQLVVNACKILEEMLQD